VVWLIEEPPCGGGSTLTAYHIKHKRDYVGERAQFSGWALATANGAPHDIRQDEREIQILFVYATAPQQRPLASPD